MTKKRKQRKRNEEFFINQQTNATLSFADKSDSDRTLGQKNVNAETKKRGISPKAVKEKVTKSQEEASQQWMHYFQNLDLKTLSHFVRSWHLLKNYNF